MLGYQAELSYNVALCHYMLNQYVLALKYLADIIERGIREHPGKRPPVSLKAWLYWLQLIEALSPSELSVGMATEGIEVRSVGNSQALHETYLIEAFNLKAAIEYHLKNCKLIAGEARTGSSYLIRLINSGGCERGAYRYAATQRTGSGSCNAA